MADLNALIAQGVQSNLPNPVDQYSKVMQLQAAQQQMQVQRQQMQQIQEDRAGFAKLRETLAQQNLTPEQYEIALTQSPDPRHQQMGVEMRFRRSRLADLEKAMGGAEQPTPAVGAPSAMPAPIVAPTAQTFDTSAAMIQPGKAYADMRPGERIQFDINRLTNPELTKPQAVYQVGGQPVPFGDYVNANIANSAGAGERAAMAAMPNVLAARVAPVAAPVANAMTAKQARIAELNRKLEVASSAQFADVPGIDKEISKFERQLKQLTESPVGKVDIDKFEPESVAKFLESGNFADLKRAEIKAGGRYLSLGAGKALDTETGQIIAADKVPAATTSKILKIGNVPYTLDPESGTLVPTPIQGGLPISGKGAAAKVALGAKPNIRMLNGVPHVLDTVTQTWTPMDVASGTAPVTGVTPGGVGKRGAVGVSDVGVAGKGDKAPTEGERKAATLLQRLQFSQSQLTQALVDDPNAAKPGVFTSAVAKLSTPLANTLTPESQQRVKAAQLDMLDAALTLGTGAAYTKEQLEGYREAYFPQIGDKPQQIRDKQQRLENVISAARIAAGRAEKLVPSAPAVSSGASDLRSAADKILGVK